MNKPSANAAILPILTERQIEIGQKRYRQLARRLGRTKNAVESTYAELTRGQRPPTPDQGVVQIYNR